MKKQLKQSFLSGLVFSGTVLLSYVGFAAFTALPSQDTGATLTKDIWNNVITTVNDIGVRTDGIYSNAGNIGIGVSNPSNKLSISATDGTNSISMKNSSNGGSWNFRLQGDATTSNNFYLNNTNYGGDIISIKSNGVVGIGTASPIYKLDVNGTIRGGGFMLTPIASNGCTTTTKGEIYYNSGDNHFYGCNGTIWKQLDN